MQLRIAGKSVTIDEFEKITGYKLSEEQKHLLKVLCIDEVLNEDEKKALNKSIYDDIDEKDDKLFICQDCNSIIRESDYDDEECLDIMVRGKTHEGMLNSRAEVELFKKIICADCYYFRDAEGYRGCRKREPKEFIKKEEK